MANIVLGIKETIKVGSALLTAVSSGLTIGAPVGSAGVRTVQHLTKQDTYKVFSKGKIMKKWYAYNEATGVLYLLKKKPENLNTANSELWATVAKCGSYIGIAAFGAMTFVGVVFGFDYIEDSIVSIIDTAKENLPSKEEEEDEDDEDDDE